MLRTFDNPSLLQQRASADRLLAGVSLAVCAVTCAVNGVLGFDALTLLAAVLTAGFPALQAWRAAGERSTHHTIAAGLMLQSAVLVHASQGAIEAHFAYFVLLAFLLEYADWRPLVVAAAVAAAEHVAGGILVLTRLPIATLPPGTPVWSIGVHAGFLIAETGVLIWMAQEIARFHEQGEAHRRVAQAVAEYAAQARAFCAAVTATGQQIDLAGLDRELVQQQSQTSRITTTVGQAQQAITGLASHADTCASTLREGLALTHQTVTEIRQALHALDQINQQISTAEQRVEELSRQAMEIEQVTGTISNIATQTNLLALNAAIEAARAGAAGQGFAVVADEVRKLSTMVGNEATKVSNSVQTLRQAREQAALAIRATLDAAFKAEERMAACSTPLDGLVVQADAGTHAVNQMTEQTARQVSGMQIVAEAAATLHAGSEAGHQRMAHVFQEFQHLVQEAATVDAMGSRLFAQTARGSTAA